MLKTKFYQSFLTSFLGLLVWELDFSMKHKREDKGERGGGEVTSVVTNRPRATVQAKAALECI